MAFLLPTPICVLVSGRSAAPLIVDSGVVGDTHVNAIFPLIVAGFHCNIRAVRRDLEAVAPLEIFPIRQKLGIGFAVDVDSLDDLV